ncbi:DUF3999 family protein [Aquincola sp. S2]|uniref:DUF3999 family protein n=1 Tax=Pseudaquabacterium terrae TaxID=2732868 RepID=A0ABX2ECI5_9BURK|nr:DUF3999 family protein [Aquabacterium terrae]NRF66164.1 DUF3999 family protein [Aquabacterium terrae]
MRLDGRLGAWMLIGALAVAARAEEPGLRYSAPVTVSRPGAFVQLPLPPAVYAHSRGGSLVDLRVIDAEGARVPFALLAPRAEQSTATEEQRPVALYLLPKVAAGEALPPTLDLRIEDGRLQVRSRGGELPRPTGGAPAGWLFDLGERTPDAALPRNLRLRWSGPAEFNVAYALDASDDLRQWRPAGGGQLMALTASPAASSPGASLTQPLVPLPAEAARYVRLRWADPPVAPAITGADALIEQRSSVALDPPTLLRLAPSPEPPARASDPASRRALHVDLGGVLPVQQVDLALPPGTQVIPLRVQQRQRADEPWQALAGGVVYRIERPGSTDGASSVSPPLKLHTQARYLRLVPDERAPALDAARTTVLVQVQLASLVFPSQGTPPYRLLAGTVETPPAATGKRPPPSPTPEALPIGTLVPQLEQERARFGRAEVGTFIEVPEAVQRAEAQQVRERWRPRLLWAVLLAGVAALGFMVWRLAKR